MVIKKKKKKKRVEKRKKKLRARPDFERRVIDNILQIIALKRNRKNMV